MIYLIYFFVLATIFHFVWEAILAPSFRLSLRYELFRMRDLVRKLHHECPDDCSEDVYRYLQGGINNGIRLLPKTDLVLLSAIEQAMKTDEALRKRIEKRRELLDACINPDVKQIRTDVQKISQKALLINLGGWAIYVVPVIVAFASCKAASRFIKNTLLIPEGELQRFSHDTSLA